MGSGLTDYWLNFILQKPLSDTTRINLNLGLLFAGNTSTGVVGIQTRRGQVYTGGASLIHDVTPRFSLGGELYGGVSDGASEIRLSYKPCSGRNTLFGKDSPCVWEFWAASTARLRKSVGGYRNFYRFPGCGPLAGTHLDDFTQGAEEGSVRKFARDGVESMSLHSHIHFCA